MRSRTKTSGELRTALSGKTVNMEGLLDKLQKTKSFSERVADMKNEKYDDAEFSIARHDYVNSIEVASWRRHYPIIDPNNSQWLTYWDVTIAFLLVVVALLSPFETAFLEPKLNFLFVVNRLVDTAFITDMGVQFFLPYQDPKKTSRLITSPRQIILRYLRLTCVFLISDPLVNRLELSFGQI